MGDSVAAVILAAGFSSRMGDFKPLLELAGMTALERTVETFRLAGVSDIRVVTGHRGEEMAPLLRRLGVRAVANPHYREGMFASVKAGVSTVEEDVEAFFIHPVDLSLVRPATVRSLIGAYFARESGVVYPAFLGERGHPPLIAGWLSPEIVRWNGAGGLQGILLRYEGLANLVEVADEQILRDMDTPDDYAALLQRAQRLHVPSEAECRALMERVLEVKAHIIGHGRAVAELAVLLGRELNRGGLSLDLPLLQAAALLHDLAREQPDHARAGASLLRELGHGAVADLVETHMDICVEAQAPVSAGEVLYLADKLMQGERRVSLTERFRAARERHAGNPEVLERIAGRLTTAVIIQKRLETVLGRSLAELGEGL